MAPHDVHTSDWINRHMFVVEDKKRGKGDGQERSEKDTLAFLLLERRAHPTSSFCRLSYLQPLELLLLRKVNFM
ncbi:hypothetical protein HMPREF0083_00324 [Aneurinibacillus aneurinilyticus ATCC 12856]|uniref:Uncharacterized protein n=1 Tax=Aneurinibacillus aneurinilyticus ATCC 12856 TaxID=649747 RepID=U1XAL2_ANEAE|nr:hypothetical protein HMPREF0083_00324 [Aneurinibacillus aneurinilyticus ATCC 12856]